VVSVHRSGDVAKLTSEVALVAIASLGGPVPASTAALTAVLRLVKQRIEADAPARELSRAVAGELAEWAKP